MADELLFCNLASGSKGNCTLVKADGASLLVDCGLSARETLRRLEAAGLAAGEVRGVVLTHEHGDHVSGVRVLAGRLNIPVYATEATWAAVKPADKRKVRHLPLDPGRPAVVAGITVQAFSVPHDAADPVGLVLAAGAARLGVATDLGQATALVRARLMGCQALVLEANHDPGMLAAGPYPIWLKQRVRGRHGHLSNQQGAELLAELAHARLSLVVLGHLSETNNRPDLACLPAAEALAASGCAARLLVAAQGAPGPVHSVRST